MLIAIISQNINSIIGSNVQNYASRKPVAAVFWSGGKDSYLALALAKKKFEVQFLVTTFDQNALSHAHHFRRELFLEQSKLLDIELFSVDVSGSDYEAEVRSAVLKLKRFAVEHLIFGDLFLKEVRKYRERLFSDLQVQVHFPLWRKEVGELRNLMERQNMRALVTVINKSKLPGGFLNREPDSDFFKELPEGVDSFGENGEFHTFCFAGKLFSEPVKFKTGTITGLTESFHTEDGKRHEIEFEYLNVEVISQTE